MLSISLCNKLLFAAALIPTTNFAATEKHTFEPDSAILRQLEEVVVTSDPKITGSLMSQPFSYTTINTAQLNNLGVHSLKDAAAFVPNLFMPDYGSRLTSAIYIRGVGSRLNTPAVGMYVDDVAVKEKSAFDTDFSDVERIDVLRGPQSTLFGRNAMGGLIRLYTFNPITVLETGSQTRIRLGASTKDAGRYVNFRTAHALASDVAMSLSGFYEGNDGFNKNTYLDRRSNGGNSGGGKLRIVYNPEGNKAFTLDFQTSLERSVENGYDYYKVDDFRDTPSLDHIGESREGELGEYRRTLWNTSLKLNYVAKHFTVTDVVGFQLLRDHMYMDQDFSPSRVFTLAQNQRSRYLSNELVFKSNENKRLQWVGGVYTARQWLKTNAPVLFQEAGIEQYIQNGINSGFAKANAAMNPMGMNIGLTIDDDNMLVSGLFNTPSTNLAAFGQATLRDLLPNLDLTAGLRIDYGQHKGRKRVACIAASLTEFRKLGPEKYQMAMKMILDGWDGDPDSLRAETVTGVCRFVDLYSGEFDPKRAVKRFRTVDPLKIYRDGRAMGDNFPGYKKYLYQVVLIYNGASKKAALPVKF